MKCRPNQPSDYALETRGLCKEFLGFRAICDVNLRIRRGDIHALIGPNGAGKTTMFNLLTKFVTRSSGDILLNGADITHTPPASIAERGMVRSFQISAIFPEMTALDNVKIALQKRHGLSRRLFGGAKATRHLDDEAMALLAEVGLAACKDLIAKDLPHGQRRSIEFAATLAMDPHVLLLDEPTQGMGIEDVDLIARLIKKISAKRTIVIVEHNLKVIANISDRVTVLARGAILAEGSYDEVSKNAAVTSAYIGAAHA
ncbi:amino acid ABC transporter ATP-binding protein [Caballeronia novacaledonica]|uniref:Amino acid ABC transporter ATP-binding protein n=1 Tax=Caballeronia novacaledonica TaxID=1544861 RepID=A0A2U3I2T5_9BURK|nr:ABC transporter ATP-binding protein [Caballeronia novacaledonica]SPB14450.1 amino acid ABC transporter ATP-binding protein [Caballeronia novacaledonica]